LGKTYFKCAQQDFRPESEKADFLRKAVEQFEQTLQLDAEDIDAHEFLTKCYSRLAGGKKQAAAKVMTFAQLEALAKEGGDVKAARSRRLEAAQDLVAGLTHLGARKPQLDLRPEMTALAAWPRPGLPVNLALSSLSLGDKLMPPPRILVLQTLAQHLYPVYEQNGDQELKQTAAGALAHVHLIS